MVFDEGRRDFLRTTRDLAVGGTLAFLLGGCGTRKKPAHEATYESVIASIERNWHHYVQFKHRGKLQEVVRLAYEHLQELANGRIRINGNRVTVNLHLGNDVVPFHTTVGRYLEDVASGFISAQIDDDRATKLPKLIARNFNDDIEGIDALAGALAQRIPHRPDSLSGKISMASALTDFLVSNSTYKFDEPSGRLSSFFSGQKGTPYNVPFRGFTFDYFKSTPQFLIDGTGDCDDYSTTAATLLAKTGLPSYRLMLSYPKVEDNKVVTEGGKVVDSTHVIIGIGLTASEYKALGDYETYLGLVAEQMWRATKEKFKGNNHKWWKYSNYQIGSSMRVTIDGKRMLLIEPQSKKRWKAFGIMDWNKEFNKYMGDNLKFDGVWDIQTGKALTGQRKWRYWDAKTLEKAVVHRDGKVEFFTDSKKYVPFVYHFGSK